MSIQIVKSGTTKRADRIVLTGIEGIGKSSFAAGSDTPLFMDFEGGLTELDVPEVEIESYAHFKSILSEWPMEYKTCVIDTLDKMEEMMRQYVCQQNGWPSIEAPGYGKGWLALEEEGFNMLSLLDKLREQGIEIILIAHVVVANFSNPAGADYSRYVMNVHKKIAEPIRHWADVVLFACHEETVRVAKGQIKEGVLAKGKAIGSGKRIIYTEREPAFDAKNRYGLPNQLPLDYKSFSEARTKYRKSKITVKPKEESKSSTNDVFIEKRVENESLYSPKLPEQRDSILELKKLFNVLMDQKGTFKLSQKDCVDKFYGPGIKKMTDMTEEQIKTTIENVKEYMKLSGIDNIPF